MSARRNADGVTLLELMIAVAILGVIIVPLTGALITGLINTGEANARLSESRSSLFTSAFFADDVQSSEQGLLVVGGSPTWQCGSGTNVLTLGWAETTTPQTPTPTSPPPPIRVTYALSTDSAGKPVLKRNFCGSSGTSSLKVAPVLTSSTPVITCWDASNTAVSCDSTGTSAPRRVQLVAQTPNSENYFTLLASRRPT